MPIHVRVREIMERKYGTDRSKWPSVASMAKILGMDRRTVEAWIEGSVSRTEFETLDKWCWFLKAKIQDILVREEDGD